MEQDEFNEGIILPPLLIQLRRVLDQYPDDGQILKELVQNAEDASAGQVKFLYDNNDYGKEPRFLAKPGLEKYQGPALYAYNDALFKEEDWKGIRMLSQSVKHNDPLKVGYFGMGFKSVFHMTDFPSVLSGERLGVIDPHEEFFEASTYGWHLSNKRHEIDSLPHQFAPYKNIFDCNERNFREGFYKGTLFRFPLREKSSYLSDKVFNEDKVEVLFESFMADAHLLLLFLRHVECVEIYERGRHQRTPKLRYKVCITDDCIDEVRRKRRELLHRTHETDWTRKPLECAYPLRVQTTKYDKDGCQVKEFGWLVLHQYCGTHVSTTFKNLQNDAELGFYPWVGVAMELDTEHSDRDSRDPDGQLFCFLPLPLEDKSPSGLPVHVNGCFALEHNRKYLKWPNATQHVGLTMDKKLMWNHCMLTEAVPRAYAALLLNAVQVNMNGGTSGLSVDTIYRAFADHTQVERRWEVVLLATAQEVFQHRVIHTSSNGGEWITAREAVFDTLDDDPEMNYVINDILSSGGVKIAHVPSHVLQSIKRYCHLVLKYISPEIVSQAMKKVKFCNQRCREDRLLMLRYFLQNGRYDVLDGLELLPLADGSFVTISYNPRRAQPVYIPTRECPRSLLGNIDEKFLDLSVGEELVDLLSKAAKRGYTQLKLLTKESFASLLPKLLPPDWAGKSCVTWTPGINDHPTWDWLENTWAYLNKHCQTDLSLFENLPLIPVETEHTLQLASFSQEHVLVVQNYDGLTMDSGLETILPKLDITVLNSLPDYVRQHQMLFVNYVKSPSYIGIMNALLVLQGKVHEEFTNFVRDQTNDADKLCLRKQFAYAAPHNLKEDHYSLLHKLPLFEVVKYIDDAESRFVSYEEVSTGAPKETFNVPLSKSLIDVNQQDSQNLANLLKMRIMSPCELLQEVIFKDIEEAFYEPEQIETVMVNVLRHFQSFLDQDPTFLKTVKSLAFLPRGDMLVTADRFFEPDSELLQKLFYKEQNFPQGIYSEPALVAVLRDVGLRGPEDIEPEDLLETARCVADFSADFNSFDKERVEIKADTLMDFLSNHMGLLSTDCEGSTLGKHLQDIKWVRARTERPSFYPDSLPWTGEKIIVEKPIDIVHHSHTVLVGSVMPVIASTPTAELAALFEWDQNPDCEKIVEHLAKVVECYNSDEKAKFMDIAVKIYSVVQNWEENQFSELLQMYSVKCWVWHGDGFVDPCDITFQKPFTDLRPYLFSVPTEVSRFRNLFIATGVLEDVHLPTVLLKIKDRYDSGVTYPENEVKRDLHLSISILNEVKSAKTPELLKKWESELVLPLHRSRKDALKFAILKDCTYCDQEWWRQGHDLDDLSDLSEDQEHQIMLVHHDIPMSTLEDLDVPTLMSRMLDVEEIDISFGQSDSLTHRLNVLLQDYTDGFAVPKELVQNADDAGATEVKFLYDERENEDAKTCLIDEGMRECQGPSFWAYNDAVFSDEDFENITKLAGATKENQTDKIGRFGLGFNAVYNLTDVPSFVSRHNIVIFDPHTTHLGRSIKNKSKPGIKIDMQKHRKKLKRLGNQFKPYSKVFGCDLRTDVPHYAYNATLFRFPLRTKSQASQSEICQRHYDEHEMKSLLSMFIKGADTLLLFTQNIQSITLYHLPKNATDASSPREVFKVSKAPVVLLRELNWTGDLSAPVAKLPEDTQNFVRQSNILKAASDTLTQLRKGYSIEETPKMSQIFNIESYLSHDGEKLLEMKAHTDRTEWMISCCMGTRESLRMSLGERSLLPTGGVAVKLQIAPDGDGYIAQEVFDTSTGKHNGTIFTYLPLPIHSGLPVHINGAFSVTSSRRHLCESNEDDKFDMRAMWNEALMEDAITTAYITLLTDFADVASPSAPCHTLWPSLDSVEGNSKSLTKFIYKKIASLEDSAPAIFSDSGKWVNLARAEVLDYEFYQAEIEQIALNTVRQFAEEVTVVNLPPYVWDGFKNAEVLAIVQGRCMTMYSFYKDIVFPNVREIELRERLILHALHHGDKDILNMVKQNACIPASHDAAVLRKPDDLVDPHSSVGPLYDPSDECFPADAFSSPDTLQVLRNLGMKCTSLDREEVLGRFQSIPDIDSKEGLKRAVQLVRYLNKAADENDDVLPASLKGLQSQIHDIPFLPLMNKPQDFPLTWFSSQYEETMLLSPQDVHSPAYANLAGPSCPIVSSGFYNGCGPGVRQLLGLDNKSPAIEDVINTLGLIMQSYQEFHTRQTWQTVGEIAHSAYHHLQDCLEKDKNQQYIIREHLKGKPFIVAYRQLLSVEKVAFDFKQQCEPYLFRLPDELQRNYGELFRILGVADKFDTGHYIKALQDLHKDHEEEILSKEDINTALTLANLLSFSLSERNTTLAELIEEHGTIYIPDADSVMRSASELCFNEPSVAWLPSSRGMRFSHPNLPFAISKQLGVNTQREDVLKKHSRGIPFGQRERLTNRIQRILSGYPCDKEIFKELLQNADDAHCTEIHFVKDPRKHRSERVFDETWKPLQGPALCVYNNRPFRQKDIDGIQRLGEGSKSTDLTKTGQYGVGFNCVYHLTDAPSFLTCGQDVGETLCVFDPHGKYVPGASPTEPGRRYDNIMNLRHIFSDIFPTYLEETFDLSNATMFRLPLRTPDMAAESELSDQPISMELIDTLLAKFRTEAFDCLLFVNHVKKISISEVDKTTNRLLEIYSATAEINEADLAARNTFARKVREVSEEIAENQKSVESLPCQSVVYSVKIVDNKGYWEKWLVSKQFGFSISEDLDDSVRAAIHRGDLKLLPRGGVAALIDCPDPQAFSRNRRAFCFLPLPIQTGLPVHINGHFALDHEARRNLWRDEDTGYKTEWNNAVVSQVIAPAYVRLLENTPERIFQTLTPTEDLDCYTIEKHEEQNLTIYQKLFPMTNMVDAYYQTLIDKLYRCIDYREAKVLPVVKPGMPELVHATSIGESTHYILQLLPTSGESSYRPYFDDLDSTLKSEEEDMFRFVASRSRSTSTRVAIDKSEIVRNVLVQSGMKLVNLPLDVYERFREAGVTVNTITPGTVVSFFKKNQDFIETLPSSIENTPLRTSRRLQILMQYLQMEQQILMQNLEGLPLLLTADGNVRVYTSEAPVFLSKHQTLLPDCASVFVHKALLEGTFADMIPEQNPVFKALDIQQLSEMLPTTISPEEFCCGDKIPRSLNTEELPNARWISELFTFIIESIEKDTDINLDSKKDIRLIKNKLRPLNDWCLLPAYIPKDVQPTGTSPYRLSGTPTLEEYLVPIGMADTVIDFSQASITSYNLRDSLRRLELLELHNRILDTGAAPISKIPGLTNAEFGKALVCSLDRPQSVLEILKYSVDCETFHGALALEDCNIILKYFNDCLDQWKDDGDALFIMGELPCYLTAHGEITHLGPKTAYVLPSDVPNIDMDAWEDEEGIVFLRANPFLNDMYEVLGCTVLSLVDLYRDFIFKHFDKLNAEARQKHLEYIKDSKLFHMRDEQKNVLLQCLRELHFLPNDEGILQKASAFYDPTHKVFRAMFHDNKNAFPPRPYGDYKWLDFLKSIGLLSEVTFEMYQEFATTVAMEAEVNPGENTLNQARALVSHMFSLPNVVKTGLLEAVADIPFIPSVKVNKMMNRLVPQYGCTDVGTTVYIQFRGSVPERHEYLVWSSSPLLPNWANPLQLGRGDFNIKLPGNDPLSDFDAYRQAMMQTLGIEEFPSVKMVIQHCLNLCNVQVSMDLDELNAFMKLDVMKAVYKYLQHQVLDSVEQLNVLSDAPCIMLDQGRLFVTPSVVSITLPDEEQIPPYMYRLPVELGEFQSLFLKLGVTQTPTAHQFASILNNLAKCTGNYRMHPNEMVVAFKCTRGLFKTLKRHPETAEDLTELHLPSRSGHLVESQMLVHVDDMDYMDRIQTFDKPMLIDLSSCQLGHTDAEDYLKLLPRHLKPMSLTGVVSEKIQEACRYTQVNSGVADKLRNQIHSKPFNQGIVRLMKHENRKHKQFIDVETMETVPRILRSIRIFALSRLVTFLTVGDDAIPDSEREAECLTEYHEGEESVWGIYICNSLSLDEELYVSVAENLNKIMDGVLRHSVQFIQAILNCPPHSISRVLDKLKIRPDQSVDQTQTVLPPPGSFIPLEDHHLLSEEFEDFETGEYVGYELDDPGLTDSEENGSSATYIYAIIVEKAKLEASRESAVMSQYIINIGDNHPPITVPTTDLYKFIRVERFMPPEDSPLHDRSFSCDDLLSQPPEEKESSGYDTGSGDTESKRPSSARRSGSHGRESMNQSYSSSHDTSFDHIRVDETPSPMPSPKETHKSRHSYSDDVFHPHDQSSPRRPRDTPENQPPPWEQPQKSPKHFQKQRSPQREYQQQQAQDHQEHQQRNADSRKSRGSAGQSSQRRSGSAPKSETQVPRDEPDNEPRYSRPPPEKEPDKPIEEIKNDISDALEQAWDMPEAARKKVIKRLLLRWHPDKNIENEKLATEVTQYIQSEIARLEQGLPRFTGGAGGGPEFQFHPNNPFRNSKSFQENYRKCYEEFFNRMNNRAREHRDQRERYRQNFSKTYTSSSFKGQKFDVPPTFTSTNPQPAQAKKWLLQAEADLRSATNDFKASEPAYEWVCLKAHQAAEKALRAAQYFVDATMTASHDLKTIAASIDDAMIRVMATRLQLKVGDSNKLYQPHPVDFVKIPHETFTRETARDAQDLSADLIKAVRDYIESRES